MYLKTTDGVLLGLLVYLLLGIPVRTLDGVLAVK